MKSIPLVDLKAQYAEIKDEIQRSISEVLDSTAFIQGPWIERFEGRFGKMHALPNSVGCSNGTAAISIALQVLGIQPGDEVITVPNTFIATVEAILQVGAIPKFVDIDRQTHQMSSLALLEAIGPKTRAILPVHLFGNCAPMTEILNIARDHRLVVVEDCAQAHFATLDGRFVGTFGDAATFSFYPGKNLGAYGDAGLVAFKKPEHASVARRLIDHGRLGSKYVHETIGQNQRMDTLQAAVLETKLNHILRWTDARRARASTYKQHLESAGFQTVKTSPGADPAFHLFVVEVANRRELIPFLKDHGIQTGIHYEIPLHQQPALRSIPSAKLTFPKAEDASQKILSLPLYPELTEQDQMRILDTFFEGAKPC